MDPHTRSSTRIGCGCARLDMMCGGGFYRDSIILVSGPTGTGKTLVADAILLLRYVELMGEIRRGLAVLKMRGSWHDNAIREYKIDDTGINLSAALHGVEGILAGTPVRHPPAPAWAGAAAGEGIHGPHSQRKS